MVVMAIMAILMGLTGGLVTKTIDQQTRQVELQKIRQLFKRLSYHAYYTGYPIDLRMQKSTITITENNQQTKIDFEQLVFSQNDYIISTNSSVRPTKYKVLWNNTIQEFTIQSVFENYESE
jgi:type II secretory pathway pseudopilin PulG